MQYAEGETRAEVFDDGDPLQRGARLPRTPHPTGETMIDRWDQIQCIGSVSNSVCGSGFSKAKFTHKKRKKNEQNFLASAGCSLGGAGCFSCSLNFVSTILFLFLCLTKSFEFLMIKILDQGRGPDLDPDRIQ